MGKLYNKLLAGSILLLFSIGVNAQDLTINGKVTDALNGEAVVGVNIIIKGTISGTITDIDGNYSLIAPSGSVLLFSFIGYLTQEFDITSMTTIDVTLEEDITNLEEIVITGLASSIKRSNLANAVGTISAEELVGSTGQPTLDGALYGKLTGVNIVASSGAPGGGYSS